MRSLPIFRNPISTRRVSLDVDGFNVPSPEYFKAIDELMKTTPIDDLKAYLRWQLLQDHARDAHRNRFSTNNFLFWRAFTGETQQDPRWFTCLYATLTALGDAVAVPFVSRFYDESGQRGHRSDVRAHEKRVCPSTPTKRHGSTARRVRRRKKSSPRWCPRLVIQNRGPIILG